MPLSFPSPDDGCRVTDVVAVLDAITGGRISAPPGPDNPWYVTKDSGLPGKAVTETPGLVIGDPNAPVRRLGIAMTLTEHHIELARAIGVDVIVAHHPVADAASAGGVLLRDYLPLYELAVIECHEAFHGLHPGIPYLHGHEPFHTDGAFGGVHGKVVSVGRPLPGVNTLGDVLARLRSLLERQRDEAVLDAERAVRGSDDIVDSATAPGLRIVAGTADTPLGAAVIHAFPHTGFSADDLDVLLDRHPDVGALLLSISGVGPDDDLVRRAVDRGIGVLVGSSHPSEILENGLPLAEALDRSLPGVEVLLLRDRVVALPLDVASPGSLGDYRRLMGEHLLARATTTTPSVSIPTGAPRAALPTGARA